jgi:curved DNA-binding protein CbpA
MFSKALLKPCTAQLAKSSWHSHSYATVTSPPHDSFIWPPTPYPTPYQILEMDPHFQKYEKNRFAQLVKLYHPDRAASVDPRCAHVPKAVRLERYHMVITAHDILSNPQKRLAYDRFGAGWASFNMPPAQYASAGYPQRDANGYPSASSDPYGARMNATWEDWEAWRSHNRGQYGSSGSQDGTKEGEARYGEPIYMPHWAFAIVLGIATMTGGLAQHSSAKSIAAKRGVLREDNHINAVREYESLKKSTMGTPRQEALETFAKSRESHLAAVQRRMGG